MTESDAVDGEPSIADPIDTPINCRVCGTRVARRVARCPECHCKHPDRAAFKQATRGGNLAWVIVAAVAFALWKWLRG